MNWKSTAIVSGATLLATWLGWTSTPPRTVGADASLRPARDLRSVGGSDIQNQAAKLEHRVRAQVEYQDPTRNPFVFGSRRPAAHSSTAASAPIAPVAVAPAIPAGPAPLALTLAGIAA